MNNTAPHFSPAEVRELQAEFLAGTTMSVLALSRGVSVGTISRAIRATGPYAGGRAVPPELFAGHGPLEERIAALRATGASIAAVARRLGIHRSTATRIVRRIETTTGKET